MQLSVIQGDQDKILQHEDEVGTRAQGVLVQTPQSTVQGDYDEILPWGEGAHWALRPNYVTLKVRNSIFRIGERYGLFCVED